jgi:hypothetical protein
MSEIASFQHLKRYIISGMDSDQKFKWALLAVDCMKQLRAEGFHFVDQEVIPNCDGAPNRIFVWFICEHYYAGERFDVQTATEALKNTLRNAGFPQDGIETLKTGATSLTEIQSGGGRFYFFR